MRMRMKCWKSGDCAGLENFYILTAVVVINDSNTRRQQG